MEDLIGKQLGAFQITAPLGEGGMASVYKAYQPRMDRYVALKVLPRHFSKNPEFVSRFSLEARVIAKLEHPHILPVYDFGESDGFTYLAMRLLEGGSLSDLLKERGKLAFPEINRIITQVGGALYYAHQQGVIHRDIKPENVLTDAFDNCLLTDFGIAKIVEATTHLTHTGGILGTPSYVSPEQGTGKPIDHRSDIYSLGVVLYRMAVGKLPYKADTPMGVVFQHCFDPIPLPRQHAPDVPEPVERVILKALAKETDDRFATAGEMVKAMQEAVEAPAVSEPVQERAEISPEAPIEIPGPSPPEPLEPEKPAAPVDKFPDDEETMLEPAPPKAGRKLPWVVAVAVVLAVAASAAWFWIQKTKPSTPVITSLFVDTEPKSATVKLLNSDTPFYQGIELEAGRYHLKVSANGYETKEMWVKLMTGGDKHIEIRLKVVTASLFVETEPSGAGVRILNVDAPFRQGMPLKLGRYQLEVSAAGYESRQMWVDLDAEGKKRIDIQLKPLTGVLFVNAEPSGAAVRLLNSDISFRQGIDLNLGHYQVEVSAKGYETRKIRVDLNAKGEKRVDVQLKPLTVALYVDTEPKDANVKILNIDEPFRQGMVLKLGRYHVQVSADGYETQKTWLDLDAAGEKQVKVGLKPIVASLYVNTEPEKADVKLLNSDTTFRQGIDLKLGRYQVEVSADGYETRKMWVDLKAKGEKRIDVQLKPLTSVLFVNTVPKNARIKLLNSDIPFRQGVDLKLGRYQVEITAEGYESRKEWVDLDTKGDRRVDIKLKPLTAALFVHTDPKGTNVKILNVDEPFRQGMTLKLGRYHLEVSADGYETEKMWTTLDAVGEKRIDVKLKRGKKISNSLGMKFVYIPPGTFTMGSPSNEPGRYDNERQHQVTLTKGFYMQTTEITQGQWMAVMGSNPSYFKNCGDSCPVEQVSWNDVQEFIRKLNGREGSGNYRLPTEAEWEYAARAGTDTPFSFGRCLSTDQANYNGNYPLSGCPKGKYRKRTIAAASFFPNAWGLYDMHGNVWEWCQDWYGNYPSGSVTDPKGASSGSYRMLRGGSWYDGARYCRSANRYGGTPGRRGRYYGFRLVLLPGQ